MPALLDLTEEHLLEETTGRTCEQARLSWLSTKPALPVCRCQAVNLFPADLPVTCALCGRLLAPLSIFLD